MGVMKSHIETFVPVKGCIAVVVPILIYLRLFRTRTHREVLPKEVETWDPRRQQSGIKTGRTMSIVLVLWNDNRLDIR